MKTSKTTTFVADQIVLADDSDHAWLTNGYHSTPIKPSQVLDFIPKLPVKVTIEETLEFTVTSYTSLNVNVDKIIIKAHCSN